MKLLELFDSIKEARQEVEYHNVWYDPSTKKIHPVNEHYDYIWINYMKDDPELQKKVGVVPNPEYDGVTNYQKFKDATWQNMIEYGVMELGLVRIKAHAYSLGIQGKNLKDIHKALIAYIREYQQDFDVVFIDVVDVYYLPQTYWSSPSFALQNRNLVTFIKYGKLPRNAERIRQDYGNTGAVIPEATFNPGTMSFTRAWYDPVKDVIHNTKGDEHATWYLKHTDREAYNKLPKVSLALAMKTNQEVIERGWVRIGMQPINRGFDNLNLQGNNVTVIKKALRSFIREFGRHYFNDLYIDIGYNPGRNYQWNVTPDTYVLKGNNVERFARYGGHPKNYKSINEAEIYDFGKKKREIEDRKRDRHYKNELDQIPDSAKYDRAVRRQQFGKRKEAVSLTSKYFLTAFMERFLIIKRDEPDASPSLHAAIRTGEEFYDHRGDGVRMAAEIFGRHLNFHHGAWPQITDFVNKLLMDFGKREEDILSNPRMLEAFVRILGAELEGK